jgi:putative phage-type endonuclease
MKKAKHHEINQNSEEWLELRKGKFTASTFKNLFLSKTTAGYNNEIYRVVYERLTGESPESFNNEYMDRGHELEPFARNAYEMESFNTVLDGGFFELNDYVGCSPDGLVDEDGQVEIKCPKYSTHIKYLLDKKLPSEYLYQVHGQLYVTGREWSDFIAYHPQLEPQIIRVYPDNKIIEEIKTELEVAIGKVDEIIHKLKRNN